MRQNIWTSFLKRDDLPTNCIVHARVTDDSLDDEDFGVIKLTIIGSQIVDAERIKVGIYSMVPIRALKTVDELCRWSNYDNPRRFHEVRLVATL